MTTLGKVLVFLNAFVAVVLFGWAVSIYTNRVDWFDRTPADGAKIDGQITQLQAEVKRYADQIKVSQQAYAAAAIRCADAEARRDYRNFKFFNEDATQGRTLGLLPSVRAVDDKVRFREQVRYEKSALIDVDKIGAELQGVDAKPLRGLGFLRKRFDDLSRESIAKEQSLRKLRADYTALCDQIDQVQAEVTRQKIITNNLKDEQEFLADARINWEEQLRTLEIRKAQLQARLASK
jgi:prefoldin subunit 5